MLWEAETIPWLLNRVGGRPSNFCFEHGCPMMSYLLYSQPTICMQIEYHIFWLLIYYVRNITKSNGYL
jgi:hypothetical protein